MLFEERLLPVEADLHLGEDQRQEVAPEVDQALARRAVLRMLRSRAAASGVQITGTYCPVGSVAPTALAA